MANKAPTLDQFLAAYESPGEKFTPQELKLVNQFIKTVPQIGGDFLVDLVGEDRARKLAVCLMKMFAENHPVLTIALTLDGSELGSAIYSALALGAGIALNEK